MKKISFLMGALLLVGCSQDNKTTSTDQQDVEVKQALFSEKGKAFLEFALNDDFETLVSGGEAQITEYFPLYTAEQITSDYGKNEIRANSLYKNKQFFITGVLGIFPRKRTKASGAPAIPGLPGGITLPNR